ncbi:hypothetical protein [Ruminococcus sp. NK3A76]|nr:hypothetical protein [Ruminococcus sp. NK3A76]
MPDVNNNNSSSNARKEPSSTYSRGSNIPTPKKKPPMPPVKSPKKNK